MTAGLKGHERESRPRSRGLSTRGRGSYIADKLSLFTLVDRGGDHRYVAPAKSAVESTVQLLLDNREEESLMSIPTDFERTTHSKMMKTSSEK